MDRSCRASMLRSRTWTRIQSREYEWLSLSLRATGRGAGRASFDIGTPQLGLSTGGLLLSCATGGVQRLRAAQTNAAPRFAGGLANTGHSVMIAPCFIHVVS